MNRNRQLVFAALCTALGIVLPLVFHIVPNAGDIFQPMHIPVLLCGFLCAWPYALLCGIATPVLSCLLTNMPTFADLPAMTAELALYATIPAVLRHAFPRVAHRTGGMYATLITAMLAGRIAAGVLKAFLFRAGAYSLSMWLTASFVTAIPGIMAQLVIVPVLVIVLRRMKA